MISARHVSPFREPELTRALGDFVSLSVFGKPDQIHTYCAMAVTNGEQLIAAVLYNNWHPDIGIIEMHAASIDKRWLTRAVLKSMFEMPFDGLGCQMCVLRVSEHNEPMLRIARAYGFRLTTIPRLRGRNEAEVVCTLTDDDWRSNRFHKESA